MFLVFCVEVPTYINMTRHKCAWKSSSGYFTTVPCSFLNRTTESYSGDRKKKIPCNSKRSREDTRCCKVFSADSSWSMQQFLAVFNLWACVFRSHREHKARIEKAANEAEAGGPFLTWWDRCEESNLIFFHSFSWYQLNRLGHFRVDTWHQPFVHCPPSG